MKTLFTQDYLLQNKGCYSTEQAKSLSFMQKEEFTIEDIVNSEIPLKHKFWFVTKKCDLTIRQNQEIAIGCASIVLSVYENKYPEDKRPREAIEAANDYLNGKISLEDLNIKRRAAYAAATAYTATAYTAYAAAASAAYVVDAADAYVVTTYAAAASAAAYAVAAADDVLKNNLSQFLNDFIRDNRDL